MDLQSYVPKDKFDIAAIDRARAMGFPALNGAIPDLLSWVRDANWPVADDTASLLTQAGPEIVPHIQSVLRGKDAVWKYWTIDLIVRPSSPEVMSKLQDELERLARNPNQHDRLEGVDLLAQGVLATWS